MSEHTVCPIILAAGQSTRFGSDKLLHPIAHRNSYKPIVIHTLEAWLSVFNKVNVVVRDDNLALLSLLKQSELFNRLTLISASAPETGLSASLMSGIKANQTAPAWLIGLADMPFIQSCVINDSKLALEESASITQAEFNGQRGHPVGFNHFHLSELLQLDGDKGAKRILRSAPEKIVVINSPDDGVVRDIDTQDSIAQCDFD
jgi:molybdenum cofactor cytidylyltransferase